MTWNDLSEEDEYEESNFSEYEELRGSDESSLMMMTLMM